MPGTKAAKETGVANVAMETRDRQAAIPRLAAKAREVPAVVLVVDQYHGKAGAGVLTVGHTPADLTTTGAMHTAGEEVVISITSIAALLLPHTRTICMVEMVTVLGWTWAVLTFIVSSMMLVLLPRLDSR